VNSSDNQAVIRLAGDDVVYHKQGVELWRVPLKSIAVIGEYTTPNGPYVRK